MCKLKQIILIISSFLVLEGCATFQSKSNGDIGITPKSQALRATLDANALYQQGREYHQKGEYAEAIQAYEKVVELRPNDYEAYNGLGVIYSILGEHELGIKFISEAIRLTPLASHLHNNLGYAYLKQGRMSEAAGAFERALQLDPENLHARNNLESAYQKMGCVQNQPCGQWQESK